MRKIALLGVAILVFVVVWQFVPPLTDVPLIPQTLNLRRSAWISVEWVMESHTDAEIDAFAAELTTYEIQEVYLYVSYLRVDGIFNPTYDHALALTKRLHTIVPQIRLLAWIGVPIQGIDTNGRHINRLENPQIRADIAEFSAMMVTDFGFDGVHLNAEMAQDSDSHYLNLLNEIRAALPQGAFLSVTAHAIRMDRVVTLTPYPMVAHHWTPEYLWTVASHVDQITLMAYDSGLPFPADYRNWVAYQVKMSAYVLANSGTELVIGLPTSEEWTPSHQTQAETFSNALYGLRGGLNEQLDATTVAGVAIYPYWETSPQEWQALTDSF